MSSLVSPWGVANAVDDEPFAKTTQSRGEPTEAVKYWPPSVRSTNDRLREIRPETLSLTRPRPKLIRDVPGS